MIGLLPVYPESSTGGAAVRQVAVVPIVFIVVHDLDGCFSDSQAGELTFVDIDTFGAFTAKAASRG